MSASVATTSWASTSWPVAIAATTSMWDTRRQVPYGRRWARSATATTCTRWSPMIRATSASGASAAQLTTPACMQSPTRTWSPVIRRPPSRGGIRLSARRNRKSCKPCGGVLSRACLRVSCDPSQMTTDQGTAPLTLTAHHAQQVNGSVHLVSIAEPSEEPHVRRGARGCRSSWLCDGRDSNPRASAWQADPDRPLLPLYPCISHTPAPRRTTDRLRFRRFWLEFWHPTGTETRGASSRRDALGPVPRCVDRGRQRVAACCHGCGSRTGSDHAPAGAGLTLDEIRALELGLLLASQPLWRARVNAA